MIRARIISYNPSNRVANVELIGQATVVVAQNILNAGNTPSTALVNIYLDPNELDTVMPSESFIGNQVVAVSLQGSNWILLGLVVGEPSPVVADSGRPGPGPIDITQTITSTGSKIKISEVGERALINKISVTKAVSGSFIVKIYNLANELQASWGDGSVTLSNSLVDAAGFAFKSENRAAYIELTPAGSYTLTLSGERFA